MKNQALFSLKAKSKKLKCHLLQFLFGTLRVKGNSVLGSHLCLSLGQTDIFFSSVPDTCFKFVVCDTSYITFYLT